MEKWKVTDQNGETFITDGHCVNLCAMIDGSYTPETVKANARLIAAAPDLLEACRSANNKLCELNQDAGDTLFIAEELDMLEKAILKARGIS